MKKNIVMTFCCACIPGFGQMYMGYMKRGVSLAIAFWGSIAASSVFWGLDGFLLLLLPAIWGFAFFDTFHLRELSAEQRYYFKDELLIFSNFKGRVQLSTAKRNKYIGIALIVLGVTAIYNQFYSNVYWVLSERYPFIADVLRSIPSLFIAVALIYFGITLIRKNTSNTDEVIPFKGENKDE